MFVSSLVLVKPLVATLLLQTLLLVLFRAGDFSLLGKAITEHIALSVLEFSTLRGNQPQGQGSFSTLGKETPSFFRGGTLYITTSRDGHFQLPCQKDLVYLH